MRKSGLQIRLVLGLLLACSLAAAAQNLYGDDLVRRLASPGEIREATTIRARLRKETSQAEPLFVFTPQPFAEIGAAPNSQTTASEKVKQWYLPPWPSLDPALPPDMPEHIRLEYEARRQREAPAEVWPEIDIEGQDLHKPSALLVPRPVNPGEELVVQVTEIPPAFSVRRFYESDDDVFLELAAYGGTTSFKAEEAFKAMKLSAVKQEPMEGFGEEAFLTRIVVVDESTVPPVEEASPVEGPPLPEVPPFAELAPQDRARPEMLDSGRAAALEAPAFTDLAVADLEGKRVAFPAPPKKYVPKGGKIKQSLLVLVAYYPDEALTLTFAIEERLGTVQDLMAVAMLAQRKLRDEVVARD